MSDEKLERGVSMEVPIVILPEDPKDGVDYFPAQQMPPMQEQLASVEAPVPSVNVVVEQQRPSKFMRRAKMVGIGALAATVGIAGIQVKQWIDGWRNPFNGKSSHLVDLTIDAPETKVYENVYLNLAQMQSTFGLSLDTSLDRPGPFNCDTRTRHTGMKDEDDKITTTSNAGIIVDSLSVTRDGETVTAELSGNITLSETAVDYGENNINVKGATGGVDICVGTNEITKARGIVDVAVQEAGRVATGCALQDDAGYEIFKRGVRNFVANTDLAKGLDEEQLAGMEVEIANFSASADAIYGASVKSFRQAVDQVVGEYLAETDDHAEPNLNDRDLLNCAMHTISLATDAVQR